MKNKKFALLLTAGALAFTMVSANAFDGPGFPPPSKDGAQISHPMPNKWQPCATKEDFEKLKKEQAKKKFDEFGSRLQLTDEQKDKIEKSREKSRKKMEKIMEQEKKLHQEKREIMEQNRKDFEAILTDEQKAELKKMKEEHKAQMEKKKQEFQQKKKQQKNSKAQKTDKK